MLISDRIETEIIDQLAREIKRRPTSQEIHAFSLSLFDRHQQNTDINFIAQILLRLAIKANPYDDNAIKVLHVYRDITRQLIQREMPELSNLVSRCEGKGLPIPVIVSCEKYIDKALDASLSIQRRYFDIAPIIVRGDDQSGVPTFKNKILCVPAGDSYEALPYKVFEAWTLLEILGSRWGVIKIDDDLRIAEGPLLDIERVRAEFVRSDYMGLSLASQFHDRAWHVGKCASPILPIYGKPFLAPWARGALYFLSKAALSSLSSYYLRFPGCIQGEIYEDKAVGDVLHVLGFRLLNNPLESILQIRTDAPERALSA